MHGSHQGEHDDDHDGRRGVEPALADAVADFGGPPVAAEAPQPPTPPEPPTHHDVAPPEPPAPEPSRRRSTVREAAPLSFDESGSALAEQVTTPTASAPAPAAPEPPPQPAATEQPQEDAAKPRRSGWWSKRVLGG
jgi:ribonuclease E